MGKEPGKGAARRLHGRFFVIVDTHARSWDRVLYPLSDLDKADKETARRERKWRKSQASQGEPGPRYQVIDAAWYNPARQVMLKTGLG